MPADLGLSAGPPGSARPLRMSHASCEETARPSPGDVPVQLYDIKWPSVRSSFVQLPFTYAAYQWARAATTLLTAWRSKTGEATVSLDAGKAQPFGRSRAGKPAMAVSVGSPCRPHPGRLRQPGPRHRCRRDRPPAAASDAGAVRRRRRPRRPSQTLSETGSSLMAPLFALWAPAYHARFSQVTLRTTSSSSGTGISSAAAGHGRHRRVRRLPVARHPGQVLAPGEHPAGRGRAHGGLQRARDQPVDAPQARRQACWRGSSAGRSAGGTTRPSRPSTRPRSCRAPPSCRFTGPTARAAPSCSRRT